MGLFDGFVDPQQFSSGGGLLGRLLALPQMQGIYRSDTDLDETSVTPSSSVLPLLSPGFGPLQTNGPSLGPVASYQALQPFSGSQPPAIGAASSPNGSLSTSQQPASRPNSAVPRRRI